MLQEREVSLPQSVYDRAKEDHTRTFSALMNDAFSHAVSATRTERKAMVRIGKTYLDDGSGTIGCKYSMESELLTQIGSTCIAERLDPPAFVVGSVAVELKLTGKT